MNEFAEKMWKKATKLESEDRFRILVNYAMVIFSLIPAVIEKDIAWFFVACLFALLGLQDFCDTKIKKGLEAVVDIQEKRLNIQEKYINKLKEKNKQEKENNKELETEFHRIKSLDFNKIVEDIETGQLISKDKIREKYMAMEKEYERKVYDNQYDRTEVKKEEMYKSQVYKELLEDK